MSQSSRKQFTGLSHSDIHYIINHVFLPPRVPQANDYNVENEEALLKAVVETLSAFRDHVVGEGQVGVIDSARATMQKLHHIRGSPANKSLLGEEELLDTFESLEREGLTVACHIRDQNCGVIFSRTGASVNVEMFELSATNNAVMSAKGRLRRVFPGSAVSVPLEIFQSREFQGTVSRTLAKMSSQSAPGTKPQVKKKGEMHDEERDTTHPKMVTELFSAFLLSVGSQVEVPSIWKNTREEVFWKDSLLPWHRSALWLLIRVVLQLLFSRSPNPAASPEHTYKVYMLFFMTHILSQAQSLRSDLLVAMSAKVSRRYQKLAGPLPLSVVELMKSTLSATNQILEHRWLQIQEQNRFSCKLERLRSLRFNDDTYMSLPKLGEFIRSISLQENRKDTLTPELGNPLRIIDASSVPNLSPPSKDAYMTYELAAFESWVASNLQEWSTMYGSNPKPTRILRELIQTYHEPARAHYKGNPEMISVMFLTILELWVACDKSALQVCPLLGDYEPGVPPSLLESFNLPTKRQLERLREVEVYLKNRISRANFPFGDIFSNHVSDRSFSVRYFEQSAEHMDLFTSILSRAAQDRTAKKEEFRKKRVKYENLMRRYEESEHQYVERCSTRGRWYRDHASSCVKCGLQNQANNLRIDVHEWPLPDSRQEAKSTVFELRVPASFGHWRDVTVFVLSDVLSLEYQQIRKPRVTYELSSYLSSQFGGFDSKQRIGLLSEDKPHKGTHRRMRDIITQTEDDVCLRNGLNLKYYDHGVGCFVTPFMMTKNVTTLCTYLLPNRPPDKTSPMQRFIHRPSSEPSGPAPNTVIASQSSCPGNLSLEEYKALASLPLGHRIQWQNVLLQLASPSVDFKKEETTLVILQCILQAGPRYKDDALRSSHRILADARFGDALLDRLYEAFRRVEENWQSFQALSVFVSLARRLLSLTSTEEVRDRSLRFLADVRQKTLEWVQTLENTIQDVTDDTIRAELRYKKTKIALICEDTFNIGDGHMRRLLSSSDLACTMIQCAIVIQEGLHSIPKSTQDWTSIMQRRWERLAYRTFSVLVEEIVVRKNPALDNAIRKSWPGFRAVGEWRVHETPYHHWITGHSTSESGDGDLVVHFSTLTGELLVNGSPLSRLPREYEQHPTYSVLFGASILEIVPSSEPGMRFSCRKTFNGHTIYFDLGKSREDLFIRALAQGEIYELVPRRILQASFPVMFIDNFVHWYNKDGGYIEFCPEELPWVHSEQNWRLVRQGAGASRWQLIKGSSLLVDVNSHTAVTISEVLRNLEEPGWVQIVHHDRCLDIETPRLKLGFYLRQGEVSITSREFRGMSVDENQSIGTLVGLRNKFVLKGDNGRVRRKVIVPSGEVLLEGAGQHVQVKIEKNPNTKVYIYEVDNLLGRLIHNGNMYGTLFISYLHSLTSFPLPDPLTGKTGTEHALSILRSAAVRSFKWLTQDEMNILIQIASLTPERVYYPEDKREMQTVKWLPALDFLAQHGDFYKIVREIFDQAKASEFFYPEFYISPPKLHHVELSLLSREAIRSSTFRVSGFGAEDYTNKNDKVYGGRDRHQHSDQASRAFVTSRIMFREPFSFHSNVRDNLARYIWSFFITTGCDVMLGRRGSIDAAQLNYDARFLLGSPKFITEHWIPLFQLFTTPGIRPDKFRAMFWLSTLSFTKGVDMNILQVLVSFLVAPEMGFIAAPTADAFYPKLGTQVDYSELKSILEEECLPFDRSPEAELSPLAGESASAFVNRRAEEFESNQDTAVSTLCSALIAKWPCERPTRPDCTSSVGWHRYIDMDEAMRKAGKYFQPRFHNHLLFEYLVQIGSKIPRAVAPVNILPYSPLYPPYEPARKPGYISNDDMFTFPAPIVLPSTVDDMTQDLSPIDGKHRQAPRLPSLLSRLDTQAQSGYEDLYVTDLRNSTQSLQGWRKEYRLTSSTEEIEMLLIRHRDVCQKAVDGTYKAMLDAFLSYQEPRESVIQTILISSQQKPRVSPTFFLQRLSRKHWQKLPRDWKNCIVHYGVAISQLQRAERLLRATQNYSALIAELRNPGHDNWRPQDQPESLLLEVESDIMIRPVQQQIFRSMSNPETGKNAVMQLNMGEGKSSVIVPMVAAALADGSRLVRVIVGKPQSKQTYQMLVTKLGGLLDRRIYHMPFSRAVKAGSAEIQAIANIFAECERTGGIFLVQPEHILSFKLMGIECMLTGKDDIGRMLVQSQEYLNKHTRDIVDESDENFSVKFELVYTMGIQRPTEYSPGRWVCIHQVLDIVREAVSKLSAELSTSIEVHSREPGRFPRTRILQPHAADRIFSWVADHICATGISGFPIDKQPGHIRKAVYRYITDVELTEADIALVQDSNPNGFWVGASQCLLLLRGLMAGGVLAFAFGQKRWRVDYGLDPDRQPGTRLAVPYRAKDNPSLRSEFSHPDVVIILTSLSYYYGGLDDDDLFQTFNHLLGSDQAKQEYRAWVRKVGYLPPAFRSLEGINLEDQQYTRYLFGRLRYAKDVVDYFLAHIVFPKEMKEFPHRLSASGWDIGEVKTHATTGFSGTNDSRKVLPLGIKQLDLEAQKHTNALVLENLLQPENSVILLRPRQDTDVSVAEMLLDVITAMDPPIRVILDVGAQILELDNLGVAKEWLRKTTGTSDDTRVQAAIFFDDHDEICVLDRKGHLEPLQTSPFSSQLDMCLVFLDEAHTRGTDLKLPRDYRAAVTLGANLTKDRLVQACMRMRMLGEGQSVVFCVPDEIQRKIRTRSAEIGLPIDQRVSVLDILAWSIGETWKDIHRSMALWAAQGRRHREHKAIWEGARSDGEVNFTKTLAERYLEEEAKTLKHRYQPPTRDPAQSSQPTSVDVTDPISLRCSEFKNLKLDSAALQEEEERELSPEIEQEREDQRPPSADPAPHRIHDDVVEFVLLGTVHKGSHGYMPAFSALRRTYAGSLFDVSQFRRGLLVSMDYARTIESDGSSDALDSYQRPVQWVLTGSSPSDEDPSNTIIEHMMIISPYEANELLPRIAESKAVALHLYAPRSNSGYSSLDRLDLYTVPERLRTRQIPQRLITELNLFAGQLYFDSMEQYVDACSFLGVSRSAAGEGEEIAADGFILRDSSGRVGGESGLQSSPVAFLKRLHTVIRRNCESIDKTHVGKLLDNQRLRREDFENQ